MATRRKGQVDRDENHPLPREAGVRKGALRGSQQANRGNAGSHQGDRDRSGNPAPGHTRGEERDRHNR
jgi:hypothetical protein